MEKPSPAPEYPTRPSTRSCSECAAPIIWLYSYTLRKAIPFSQVSPQDVQVIRPHECPVTSITEQTWRSLHTGVKPTVAPETARTWKQTIVARADARKRARKEAQ